MDLWVKRVLSALSMMGGTALVFSTVVLMNAYEEPPKEPPKAAEASFRVEKKPPPKRQKRIQKKVRPKRQAAAAATPAPNLTSAISAPGFELPGFSGMDLGGNLSDKLLGDTDKKMDVVSGVACTEKPKAVRRVQASYPPAARAKGIEGTVRFNLKLGLDGTVKAIKVLDASPAGVFDQVAKEAVERWEFTPCIFDGAPAEAWVIQPITFSLEKKS